MDDLRHEEGDALEWHAEADLNGEEAVGCWVLEDTEGFADIELFVDDGAGVDLDAVEGEGFFVLG